MWNDDRALNRAASLALAMASLLIAYGFVFRAAQSEVFAIKEVRIVGDVDHITREQVKAVVAGELRGNFFTMDLAATRDAFEKLSWVRRVEVRRRWPDRLEIDVDEHRPVARWGDEALVNEYGELFEGAVDAVLPVMIGPEGSASLVAETYAAFEVALAPLGRRIAEIRLSDRQAWRLRLDDDTVIELGRDSPLDRLRQFASVFGRSVATLEGAAKHVDLRYANGFAVRVNGLKWSDKRA